MKFVSVATLAFLASVARGAETSINAAGEATPSHHRMLNAVVRPLPMTTFFVPLQEQSTFDDLFKNMGNQDKLKAPMVVMMSVTISTDKTVIWYDHWEDGFDLDSSSTTIPISAKTEIWGDGNAANGCAPHIKHNCTNINDVLNAGTSIVIQNDVPLPRVATDIVYDGGDRIQASFPVAVTRASFPEGPGSVMGGAVEVYDTTQWGLVYEAPVGAGTKLTNNTNPFEISGFSCLAAENNTRITLPNGTVSTLRTGQSIFVPVKMSDQVKSDKPIQVVLLTMDKDSTYQTRWFTMRPIDTYQNFYASPVGDSYANTAIVVYNPSESQTLTYTVTTLVDKVLKNVTRTLNPKQAALTDVIPTGSGALLSGNIRFVALSITDSNDMSAFMTDDSNGSRYDWGFPLIPRNELTSQVLIGLGFGCTNNNCGDRTDRNPVWLTPMEDADIYIDYRNTGVNQVMRKVNFLESVIITDTTDKDMSGASIFAVKRGQPKDGTPCDFAAAWGQNPAVSDPDQDYSLDMGTTIPPFSLVRVAKTVDKPTVTPNEELTYTIRVSNVGHKDLPANALTINDVLDSLVTYVQSSTRISASAGSTTLNAVADQTTGGTRFPLDEAGFVIPIALPRRGGTIEIVFKVKAAAELGTSKIINTGSLTQIGGGKIPFEATSTVFIDAAVTIENTVYQGHDGGAKCGTSAAVESITTTLGAAVTYCYRIKNTGKTPLSSVTITTRELNFTRTLPGSLAPDASQPIFVNQFNNGTLINNAVVLASPALANGNRIRHADNVTATDPSNVVAITPIARLNVSNVVYIGIDNGARCHTGVEKVVGIEQTEVVFCFCIVNTGDTHLNDIRLSNPRLGGYTRTLDTLLAPGQNVTVSLSRTIDESETNVVEVTATPVLSNGMLVPGLSAVKNSDPSQTDEISYSDIIRVDNTVYLGHDGGAKCGTPEAVNERSGLFGTQVTYCFRITNEGESHFRNVELKNPTLNYNNLTVMGPTGNFAPDETIMLFFQTTISAELENTAFVYGTPSTANGVIIPGKTVQTHNDKSKVFISAGTPKVELTNKVILGHQDATACSSSAAVEYVEGFVGTNVTHCFVVMNSGSSFLNILSLAVPRLSLTDTTQRRIAPGVSTTYTALRTVTGGVVVNNATVTARPVTSTGGSISNSRDQLAWDTASVGEIVANPAVRISNTVYSGLDEHRGCGTALDSVSGLFGAPVTYCFNVTNTGNTPLDTIRIGNEKLSFQGQSPIATLAPGASIILTTPRIISITTDNTARVTARPIRPNGSTLPTGEVSHTDNSEVRRLPHAPSVVVNNTVYIGVDGSCNKAVESVKDIYRTKVTYCLQVTNTGNSHLNSIKLDDKELNFTATLPKALAPGRSETISIPGQITSDLVNTATVTANPILECGTDIPGVDDVKHSDPSKVEKQTFTASISAANTVYLGHEDGKCGSSGESVKGLYDSKAMFCFKITNTGQTHLRSLTLSNVVLGYNQIPSQTLAPGASASFTFPSKILATGPNTLNVTAVPITEDGRDILDLDEVEASDPSSVELIKHSPVVTIDNTVYLGTEAGKCSTGKESVSDQFGKAVHYCFTITNNGNSHLNSIQIVNEKLGYTNTSLVNLAPGQSITLTTPGKILSSLTNEAIVTATPTMPDGTAIPGHEKVSAKDPSSIVLVAHQSGINVENKVYLGGSDGGAKCAKANETAAGYPNTGVMYCLEIKNVGESHLKDVVVRNTDLNFTDTSITRLAPQETKVLAISRMITKDLVNTATATGTPSLSDGTKIGGSTDVTDSDTSSVDQLEYSPMIEIENSVYIGVPGDKICGTDAARDGVDGIHGTKVTYCFKVTNTGDAPLKDVKIKNVNLQYEGPVKDLAPKESVIIPLEKSITVDLSNTAVVTATPTIPGLAPVSSQDHSMVNKLDFVPGIKIINKVYLGSTADNKCGTSSAKDEVEGLFGTAVTYCFTIVNSGDTSLSEIKVSNGDLAYTKADFPQLATGSNFTVAIPGCISKSHRNVAYVEANPVTATGLDIPDLSNVKHEDDSKVKKIAHESSVSIVNTLYLGKDAGAKCGTPVAVDTVTSGYGVDVQYCFFVVNTGKSHLTSVIVDNKDLGYTTTIASLAPNATKMLTVEGILAATKTNVANVTATPSLANGTVIPDMDKVRAQDPSYVVRTPEAPRVLIDNSVVLGSDATKCGTAAAVDYLEHYAGAIVTYCFLVTNTGDTHLADVVIANPKLGFTSTKAQIGQLKPFESVMVVFTSKITAAVANSATVVANPVLPNGLDIPGVNDVSWSDGSAVGLLEYKPSIRVSNTVYNGEDGGLSCASKGVESASSKDGLKVVYCFAITNTGDTYLNNIKITDIELNYTDSSVGLLAPQNSVTVAFVSTIAANLTNNVVVVGNPSLVDGADISGAQDVTATDPSTVVLHTTDGAEKEKGKDPYSPPTNKTEPCLQDKWTSAGKSGKLLCSNKLASWDVLKSTRTLQCKPGDMINVTVNGTMRLDGARNDVGWYVAADGGDALTGTCVVNGFQKTYAYTTRPAIAAGGPVGKIVWLTADGGDNDACGDLVGTTDKVLLNTPALVNAQVKCADDNEDGVLDVSICFTWKDGGAANQGSSICDISDNIPGVLSGGCYCTRYDITDVEVEKPPVAAC